MSSLKKLKELLEYNTFHDTQGYRANKDIKKGSKSPGKKAKQERVTGVGTSKPVTPAPCGREAREQGGNVRCWDGKVIRPIRGKK